MVDRNKPLTQETLPVGLQIKINTFKDMVTEGNVELHIVEPSKFKEQILRFRTFQDNNTGITWGIPLQVFQNGEIKWLGIVLRGDVIRYNLKNPSEAREWHVVKNSPFVKGSPTASLDVRYKIYDVEAEAQKYVDSFDRLTDAGQFIKGMDNNKVIAYGRLFGIAPETNSVAVIRKALLEKAKLDPNSILTKRDKESETETLVILKRAMAVGIIKTDAARGLVYNDSMSLGLNEHTAIEFLRQNMDVLVDMDRRGKQLDAFYVPIKEEPKAFA